MTAAGRRAVRWAPAWVAAMSAAYAVTFAALSLQRHRGFFTARFDLGNMTQAVWSAAHGGLLVTTDMAGNQVSRLGAHVDPILWAFAPLWRAWPDPRMLLIVQAMVVASAAVPAFLLARAWIGDERFALAFAGVTLLYPAIEWATLFDFHPVTLAPPLILWCVWALATRHDVLLAVMAIAALATKEQVGLSIAVLGIWAMVRLRRRVAGALLAVGGTVWSVVAVTVIIPHWREGAATTFVEDRYGSLGTGIGDILKAVVTRPLDVIEIAATGDRAVYVLSMLLPLLGLSLLSPLLAACALPDLVLNVLSSRPEQHSVEYHYGAVIAPYLIAAAIDGVGRLRRRDCRWCVRLGRPTVAIPSLLAAAVVSGFLLGPLPFWRYIPGGAAVKVEQYRVPARADLLASAVARVPDGAVVSAGNRIAGHLSARRRVLTFPQMDGADWVVVDRMRPDVGDRLDPAAHAIAVDRLLGDPRYVVVSDDDGVIVARRVGT